jgi:hypothetical protein
MADYCAAGDQSSGTIAGEGATDVPKMRDAMKAIVGAGKPRSTFGKRNID